MKLHFVTTSAEAYDPKSGARLYVRNVGPGAWTWRVVVPLPKGSAIIAGDGHALSEAGARGAARKCLARHLAGAST